MHIKFKLFGKKKKVLISSHLSNTWQHHAWLKNKIWCLPWAHCADFTELLQLEAQGALQLSDGWISWGLEFKFSSGNRLAAFMFPEA